MINVLLRGGSSKAKSKGGEIQTLIAIYMAGRASFEYKDIEVPVTESARGRNHEPCSDAGR